jgi:hypothetical protein
LLALYWQEAHRMVNRTSCSNTQLSYCKHGLHPRCEWYMFENLYNVYSIPFSHLQNGN